MDKTSEKVNTLPLYNEGRKIFGIPIKRLVLWRDFRDVYLMVLSCILLTVVACLAYISNAYASKHNWSLDPPNITPEGTISKRPLPVHDLMLDLIDKIFEMTGIRASIFYAMFFTNACLVLLIIRLISLGRDTFSYMRRTFTYLSITYAIRGVLVFVTVIPTPMPICYYVIKDTLINTAIYNFFKGNESCGDVFFSGHSILYTISIYTWLRTPGLYHRYVNFVISALIITFGYSSLIISKFHYTIDILCGIWFTLSIISIYNYIIIAPNFKHTLLARFLLAWEHPASNYNSPAIFVSTIT